MSRCASADGGVQGWQPHTFRVHVLGRAAAVGTLRRYPPGWKATSIFIALMICMTLLVEVVPYTPTDAHYSVINMDVAAESRPDRLSRQDPNGEYCN